MKQLVLVMTLFAWGMSEDVVPPKEVEAWDNMPWYWNLDMHPTPSIYDGDWKNGEEKQFIGKPQKRVPKQIHVEKTKEKVDVKGWTVLNPDLGKNMSGRGADGFYRLLYSVRIDGREVEYWETFTVKNGVRLGWHMEYWKETGLLKSKYFEVRGDVLGKIQGWEFHYYPNGQLWSKRWNKKGKIYGWSYHYYPNGQLEWKSWEKGGDLDGWYYEYYPNGVLKGKSYTFPTDRTTDRSYQFYPTGELEAESIDGIGESWLTLYYKNGNINIKEHNYKIDGYWAEDVENFNEDGTLSSKSHDLKDGSTIKETFNKDGTSSGKFHILKGGTVIKIK